MKISRTLRLRFFGLLVFTIFSIVKLNACSCDRPSFEYQVEYSDEIFIGKVIDVEEYDDSYRRKYQIEVEKKWKGNNDSILIFHSGWTSCDYTFDLGERYLIYANRDTITGNSLPNPWLCSRTTSERDEDNLYEEDSKRLDKKFIYEQSLLQGVNKKSLNELNNTNPKKQTIMKEAPNKMNDITKKRNNYWLILGGLVTFIAFLIFIKERI